LWRPQVVGGRVDARRRRQLNITGNGAEDPVGEEAVAEAGAVELVEAAEAARLGLTHIADRTLRIGALELQVVTAVGIELGAAACRPAHLVGRVAANLRAGDSTSNRRSSYARPCAIGSIVAAAGVMRRH